MAFKVLSQGLVSEFHPETSLNLIGNIEDKITATVDVVFEGIYYATPDFPIVYGSPNTNDPNYLRYISVNLPVFADYKVGDLIEILDPGQPNDGLTVTIVTIVNDTKFIIDQDLTIPPFNSTTGVLLNVTPMKGLKYAFGIPDNSAAPTLNSRIDGNRMEFKFEGYDVGSTAVENMIPVGQKSWQRGSCTVQRLSTGTGNGDQKFRFIHIFYIDPSYLAGQLNNLGTSFPPVYFQNDKCIRYDFLMSGGADLSSEDNLRKTTIGRFLGVTGWLKENFNGGLPDYNLVSATYKRLPSLDALSGIELTTDEQQVVLVVLADPATSFVDTFSQFRISHHYLPSTESEYKNNGKTVEENFYIDRAFTTVGIAPIAGQNFGTDQQVFTEVSAVVDNPNQITITAKIQLTQPMVDDLSARAQKRFLIQVACADHTLFTQISNRTNVFDTQLYSLNTLDAGMFSFSTKILSHHQVDVYTEGSPSPTGRIEDDMLGYTSATLDRAGRENDVIEIKNAIVEVIAEKTDGSFFVLDSYNKSFSGTPVINGEQYIDFTQQRGFKFPDNDQRKLIRVLRNAALDSGQLKVYEIFFPFIMRYESWLALNGVSNDFFDTSLANNGLNHLWHRYAADANYSIKYVVRLLSTKNGNPQENEVKNTISSFTYNEGAEWDNESVVALDSNLVELINGGDKYITLYEDMTIRSEFEYVGGEPITVGDVIIVFRIELFEQGSIFDVRWFTSKYEWGQYSVFSSVDQTGKISVSNPSGNIYRGEAILKTDELPQGVEYKISVRYFSLIEPSFCILQESQFEILLEDESGCLAKEDLI